MRIVQVSTHDGQGGAARAAYRLHASLLSQQFSSRFYTRHKTKHEKSIVAYQPSSLFTVRIHRRIRYLRIMMGRWRYRNSRPSQLEMFSDDRTELGASVVDQLPEADIVNLHWVANFVDYRSFFLNLFTEIPIVWTLHDMNAFTGGCHYSLGCKNYKRECGACPQLGSFSEKDLSREIWQRKNRIFKGIDSRRLTIVAPSRWLAREAGESPLFSKYRILVIPNGIDTQIFKPIDKRTARQALGIPSDSKVLLFVAESISNRRKGYTLLLNALREVVHSENLFIATIGKSAPAKEGLPFPKINFGHVASEQQIALIYNAADLFVIPSLQDNLPNTLLEAMACGVPSVGFDAGGISDLIQRNITGEIVPVKDGIALGRVIDQLLHDPGKLLAMSASCRNIAVQKYSLRTQAHRYHNLYQDQILNSRVGKR